LKTTITEIDENFRIKAADWAVWDYSELEGISEFSSDKIDQFFAEEIYRSNRQHLLRVTEVYPTFPEGIQLMDHFRKVTARTPPSWELCFFTDTQEAIDWASQAKRD